MPPGYPAYRAPRAHAPDKHRLDYLSDTFPIIDKTALLRERERIFPGGRSPKCRSTVAATSGTTGTPLERVIAARVDSVGRSVSSSALALGRMAARPAPGGVARRHRGARSDRRRPAILVQGYRPAVSSCCRRATSIARRCHSSPKSSASSDATQLRAYPSAAFELATLVARGGHYGATSPPSSPDRRCSTISSANASSRCSSARCSTSTAWPNASLMPRECEHGRMHVNPEYGVLEIVDQNGLATDGEGHDRRHVAAQQRRAA